MTPPRPAPLEPRLLRVVPDGDGGWSIRERRTGQVLGGARDAHDALAEATAMLPGGGLVQVVDEHGFIVAKAHVAPPPVPWPAALRRASTGLAVAGVVGLLVGWLVDLRAIAGLVVMAVGALVLDVHLFLRARRARADDLRSR